MFASYTCVKRDSNLPGADSYAINLFSFSVLETERRLRKWTKRFASFVKSFCFGSIEVADPVMNHSLDP